MDLTYSYFPGCTLKTKAKNLDIYTRETAAALGVTLVEIENWQCYGRDLVTVCSGCFHVLKRVNDDMKNVPDIRDRANRYSQFDEPYQGETKVLHYLELLLLL